MRKYTKLLVTLGLFYLLPLADRPSLILDWRILVLMASCAIVILSQPEMSVKEAEETKATDRRSIFIIYVGVAIAQILPVIEWAYFGSAYRAPRAWIAIGAGLFLLAGGIAFRLWAIRVLGRYFTATVQILDDHPVVTWGPYRFVRHPSYLGAYAAIVGSAVLLGAYASALVVTALVFMVYRYRITAEEETLISALGEPYENYCRRTNRLVPHLW